MAEIAVKLPAKEKLNRKNFLNWKVRMKSILQLKNSTSLEEQDNASLELDKKDPFWQSNAMAILTINCNVKIFSPSLPTKLTTTPVSSGNFSKAVTNQKLSKNGPPSSTQSSPLS